MPAQELELRQRESGPRYHLHLKKESLPAEWEVEELGYAHSNATPFSLTFNSSDARQGLHRAACLTDNPGTTAPMPQRPLGLQLVHCVT